MKKPNPKDYSSKDHLRGKYSDDLEKYIDYLEKNVRSAVADYEDGSGYKFHEFQTY